VFLRRRPISSDEYSDEEQAKVIKEEKEKLQKQRSERERVMAENREQEIANKIQAEENKRKLDNIAIKESKIKFGAQNNAFQIKISPEVTSENKPALVIESDSSGSEFEPEKEPEATQESEEDEESDADELGIFS
jgi:hypothetical protein